jgi:hypothetical protein
MQKGASFNLEWLSDGQTDETPAYGANDVYYRVVPTPTP